MSKIQLVTLSDIQAARERTSSMLAPTPVLPSLSLGKNTFIKWDNKLPTGSFKERGAASMLTSLSAQERSQGVIAASAGNHALALSYHASKLDISCMIVMPRLAPLVKVTSTRSYGAEVVLFGETFDEAAEHSKQLAIDTGRVIVPAFSHHEVIAGQGIAGLELLESLPSVQRVFVPVGGGGLVSGMAVALKSLNPNIEIIGVQSEWATAARRPRLPAAYTALRSISIADGIAVKTQGELTSAHIERYVDQLITVSENEIAEAVMFLLEKEHTVVEGAGAAGIAGYLQYKQANPSTDPVTAIEVCGSNIDMNLLARLIERHWSHCGRLVSLTTSVPDRPGSLNALTSIIAEGGGNVLRVNHDRSFCDLPGNVSIQIVIEVSNPDHGRAILDALSAKGLTCSFN
jgi:threonine dehydratase